MIAICELQAGLEKSNRTIILNAVNGVRLRRKPEPMQQIGRELALEGEIMNRHHGRRPAPAGIDEMGHRQTGLPIVSVDHIGDEPRDVSEADARCDPVKRPKRSALSGHSVPSGQQHREFRADRRDAVRRGRRGRVPPPGHASTHAEPPKRSSTCQDRLSDCRRAAVTAGYPGTSVTTLTPSARSARGNALATSARPPVLTRG